MNELDYKKPERHILICVNTKEAGDYCSKKISIEDYKTLKFWTKEKHPEIKLTKVLCLGHCEKGANIMVYPEGKLIVGINTINEIKEYITETT